ncbi:MAG: TIGR03013 family PEP-CTERM/XrtA system glycosyltransferase [Alphaproteobacteria bacterium]|nr:TIGR03013 family PEP-CTERM/XrtA system glycosyltransferase [Alphaproteobacteria bacterium]
MFRHFVPVSVVLLVSSDALLITGAFYQMLSQSGPTNPPIFDDTSLHAQLAAGLSAAAVTTMISVGLYGEQSFIDFRQLLSRIAVAFVLFLMVMIACATYWHDGLKHLPDPANLPLKATLIWLGCISLTRGTFLITLGRGVLKRRIAVLGNGIQAARIARLVERGENQHFVPVSYIRMPGEWERGIASATAIEWPDAGPDALAELGSSLGISEIVVAPDDRRGLPVQQLLHCKLAGIGITEFLDFWERETRTVDLEALRPSWLFYSDGFRCGAVDELAKRAFDIIVSLCLLGFTAPLLLVVGCLIKFDSSGPILYRQERVGYRGRHFTILKFRSMRIDAEYNSGPQWAARADPRITRIGAVIRKLRIDELPQILNVLRGDMSFVGPRPERPYFATNLTAVIPYYNERHWVRPGITGWAQINYPYGASIEDARRKLSFDLYYVKNRSIFLDFLILLQTARVILWNQGAR